jgi:chaperonin GroES
MQLLRNQILFKPNPHKGVTENGIFIPDSFKKESDRGTVAAVGPGTKKTPMRLKVGDECFRVYQWGTLVEKDGESLYLMDESAIIATI